MYVYIRLLTSKKYQQKYKIMSLYDNDAAFTKVRGIL